MRQAHAHPPRVYVYSYGADSFTDREIRDLAELEKVRADGRHRHWVDVQGLSDAATLERIGAIFGIHPLALADAVNTPQRPKADAYDDQLVCVTHMARAADNRRITIEQLTIVTGRNFVVTFQDEEYGDVLDPVRARLRGRKAQIVGSGPDYLTYAMLDTVVDGYYPVLESVGEELEALEVEIVQRPSRETLGRIQSIKRQLLHLRRYLWPTRDAINALLRDEPVRFEKLTRLHLRDCYDHAVQLIDMLETYRELASGLMDSFLSSSSNRLNEVMKVLTIISTIFIPMSFVAGVYGMNFQYMPELQWTFGYPLALGIMVLIALVLLGSFWRRGWIGGHDTSLGRLRANLQRPRRRVHVVGASNNGGAPARTPPTASPPPTSTSTASETSAPAIAAPHGPED